MNKTLKDIIDNHRITKQPKQPIVWGFPTYKQLKGKENDTRS